MRTHRKQYPKAPRTTDSRGNRHPPRLQMYRKFKLNVQEFIATDQAHRSSHIYSSISFDDSASIDSTLTNPFARVDSPLVHRDPYKTSTPIPSVARLRGNTSKLSLSRVKMGKMGDLFGNRYRDAKM
jgi:hypothetical protein